MQSQLNKIERKVDKLSMTDQEFAVILTRVDDVTTKIGSNVSIIATSVGESADLQKTIADEVRALVASQKSNGVSEAIVNQTQALADRLQASSDALDLQAQSLAAQIPVLQAIASQGSANVPPAPEPPPVVLVQSPTPNPAG